EGRSALVKQDSIYAMPRNRARAFPDFRSLSATGRGLKGVLGLGWKCGRKPTEQSRSAVANIAARRVRAFMRNPCSGPNVASQWARLPRWTPGNGTILIGAALLSGLVLWISLALLLSASLGPVAATVSVSVLAASIAMALGTLTARWIET